jgi:hypothetical protein
MRSSPDIVLTIEAAVLALLMIVSAAAKSSG